MRRSNSTPSTLTAANLASLLTPARIAFDMPLARPADVMAAAAGLLSGQLAITAGRISASTAEIYLGLWQRAQLSVQQISPGIALIDARFANITTAKAAIIRLAQPMDWMENHPAIHTVIASAGPALQPRQHLNAVNMIRTYFADAAHAQAITTIHSSEAYYQHISASASGAATALFLTHPFRRAA